MKSPQKRRHTARTWTRPTAISSLRYCARGSSAGMWPLRWRTRAASAHPNPTCRRRSPRTTTRSLPEPACSSRATRTAHQPASTLKRSASRASPAAGTHYTEECTFCLIVRCLYWLADGSLFALPLKYITFISGIYKFAHQIIRLFNMIPYAIRTLRNLLERD